MLGSPGKMFWFNRGTIFKTKMFLPPGGQLTRAAHGGILSPLTLKSTSNRCYNPQSTFARNKNIIFF